MAGAAHAARARHRNRLQPARALRRDHRQHAMKIDLHALHLEAEPVDILLRAVRKIPVVGDKRNGAAATPAYAVIFAAMEKIVVIGDELHRILKRFRILQMRQDEIRRSRKKLALGKLAGFVFDGDRDAVAQTEIN